MALKINNVSPTKILCNGVSLKKVICNGLTIWTPEIIDASFGTNGIYFKSWKSGSGITLTVPAGTYIMACCLDNGSMTSSYFTANNIICKTFNESTTITATSSGRVSFCIIKANISSVASNGGGSWMNYQIANTHGTNSLSGSINLPAGNWICVGVPGGNSQGSSFFVGNINVQNKAQYLELNANTVFSGSYTCGGGDGGNPTDNPFFMLAAYVIL